MRSRTGKDRGNRMVATLLVVGFTCLLLAMGRMVK